jgi:hypothetical protein
MLPDTEAFVVPPAATKSAYYRNPVTRELWQRAAQSLREADRLILIGYSLPAADLTLTGMISDALSGREVGCIVVNPLPFADGVKERLLELGVQSDRIGQFHSQHCVADFVDVYARELSELLVDRMKASSGVNGSTEGSLLVSWGETESLHPKIVLAITGMSIIQGSSALTLEVAPSGTALAPRPAQLGQLITMLHEHDVKVLQVKTQSGRLLPLIDLWASPQPKGDSYRWISFVAAGLPDDPE